MHHEIFFYLITYLFLSDDDNLTSRSFVFPFHTPICAANDKSSHAALVLKAAAASQCCVQLLCDSLSAVLSPPLSPPLHFAPSTGCICSEHAQCSFLNPLQWWSDRVDMETDWAGGRWMLISQNGEKGGWDVPSSRCSYGPETGVRCCKC